MGFLQPPFPESVDQFPYAISILDESIEGLHCSTPVAEGGYFLEFIPDVDIQLSPIFNDVHPSPPPILHGVKRVLSLESFKSNKRDPELRGKSLTVDIMAVQ